MARTTTNYGWNISEGGDAVNPLVDIFPNFEDQDTVVKAISDDAVGVATELTTGTVHALTRATGSEDRNVFTFVATSNFVAGDTFTLDGDQVSALTPDGQTLASGSYVIGSTVLVALHDTLMTVFVNPAKAKDSDKLDGEDSTYYAKASDISSIESDVQDLSTKVGTAVLTTTAPDLSGAVNELNTQLTNYTTEVDVELTTGVVLHRQGDLVQLDLNNYALNSDWDISVALTNANSIPDDNVYACIFTLTNQPIMALLSTSGHLSQFTGSTVNVNGTIVYKKN